MKIKTFFSNKYEAVTPTASMRKLGPVARRVSSEGYAELIEPEYTEEGIVSKLKDLHDEDYVEAFKLGNSPRASTNGFSWSEEIKRGVLAMNAGMLDGARVAMEEGVAANISQGFHHSCFSRGGGYCTFNGLALVANENPDKKIFVLDCDEHGGNGTHEFITGRDIGKEPMENLRQITINGTSFGISTDEQKRSVAVTLPSITDDFSPYEEALERGFGIIEDWEPDLVIYQAGADPHINDPLGTLGMTTEQMAYRDARVFEFLLGNRTPVLFVLAGGYQEPIEELLVPLHANTFK